MSDTFHLTSTIKLNDGNEIPRFGLGVYVTEPGAETYNAVTWALEAGYRHIDGARWYENEKDCGRAINDFCKKSGVPREDIWYTTKLMQAKDAAWSIKCLEESIKESETYVDLYLIHGPDGGPEARRAAWEGLCEAKDKGLARSIGVSNFGVKHLTDLLATSPKYVPSINQIDLHPFMVRQDIVTYCEANGIVLEAWAPLVRGMRFKHPDILRLAEKYKKSPAQILIRYGLDRGFVVIPKSTKQERIADNANVFDFVLEKEDLDFLNTLDEFLITDWEVSTVP
ncbi:hypothetical protein MNV49_002610 [Pseudohyphozyma bogoriensis]|nr:hypothetical protein MNV49_002610 [Pseudohyphozyma bogoriensis]